MIVILLINRINIDRLLSLVLIICGRLNSQKFLQTLFNQSNPLRDKNIKERKFKQVTSLVLWLTQLWFFLLGCKLPRFLYVCHIFAAYELRNISCLCQSHITCGMYLTEPKINTQRADNIKNGINALNMTVAKLILENRHKYQIIISNQ